MAIYQTTMQARQMPRTIPKSHIKSVLVLNLPCYKQYSTFIFLEMYVDWNHIRSDLLSAFGRHCLSRSVTIAVMNFVFALT